LLFYGSILLLQKHLFKKFDGSKFTDNFTNNFSPAECQMKHLEKWTSYLQ